MKAPRACQQCRDSKRKCVRVQPGEACQSCKQKSLRCGAELPTYSAPSQATAIRSPLKREHLNRFPADEECQNPVDLPMDIVEELVGHYLDQVHDRAHSIFHPATLRNRVRGGSTSSVLLHALCAIGSKFSAEPSVRSLEKHLAIKAKNLLQAEIDNICLENVQACILVATLCAGNCQMSSEALFVRIAISMMEMLYPDIVLSGTGLVSEITRRIWWSLYMADHWCFSGLGITSRSENFTQSCILPMDETSFRSLPPDCAGMDTTDGLREPGLWAHMLTLARHFGPIQKLNRRIANGERNNAEIDRILGQIGQNLEAWRRALPADTQMSMQNLNAYQRKELGGVFICLHLAYHHYSTLLYFRFLEDQKTISANHSYIARCKDHASNVSDLLHLARQMKGCQASYPGIGHMAVVSSSVLVHTLLFGDSYEIQKTRQQLDANFEALIELREYWPATSAMMHRLMTFQNLCILSDDSHKLDGWMVGFLLEHAVALKERDLPPSLTASDMDSVKASSKTRELMETGRYTDFNSM